MGLERVSLRSGPPGGLGKRRACRQTHCFCLPASWLKFKKCILINQSVIAGSKIFIEWTRSLLFSRKNKSSFTCCKTIFLIIIKRKARIETPKYLFNASKSVKQSWILLILERWYKLCLPKAVKASRNFTWISKILFYYSYKGRKNRIFHLCQIVHKGVSCLFGCEV